MVFQESFKDVWSFNEVAWMFQASFKGGYKEFKEFFKEASRLFQGGFRKISRVFQVRLKGVSSNFKGGSWIERSLKDWRVFQGSFQWGFKGIWRSSKEFQESSNVFQESLNGAQRKISGCFKEVSRMLQERFKGVSKKIEGQFQRHSKEVSRAFKESVKWVLKISNKVSRVFQECFNAVLFCNFVLAWISLQLPEQKEGLLLRKRLNCVLYWYGKS